MANSSLRKARLYAAAVPLAFVAMVALLLATNNWVVAFPALLVALFSSGAASNAARCPRCSRSLLQGGRGIDGVVNVLRLASGASVPCSGCDSVPAKPRTAP